jgi:hypothetical protein
LLSRPRVRFAIVLTAFALLYLFSWPIVFSFRYWVQGDRSNFLNLDYLLSDHLRLGVDTFYSYGLLPVLIQHELFSFFGRGYRPLIWCNLAALVILAACWTLVVGRLPGQRRWLITIIVLSPLLLSVNPVFPYSLVQLSMLSSLVLLLYGKPEIALAVATIGCFSVPSLPLLLTSLIALYMIFDWWLGGHRSAGRLALRFVPGIAAYLLLASGLGLVFGFGSVRATALPLLGARFYSEAGLGKLGSLLAFLYPPGHSTKYYIAYYVGSPATWFVVCVVTLGIFGVLALARIVRQRHIDPPRAAVVICAILLLVYSFVAFGGPGQHLNYDPILAFGMLIGISLLPVGSRRSAALLAFALLGCMANAWQLAKTGKAWLKTRPLAETASLYADPGWTREWSSILRTSTQHKVLFLSNGTGVHHYFPSLQSPQSWYLGPQLMFPNDKARVRAQLREADVIVEDVDFMTSFAGWDEDVEPQLKTMCKQSETRSFRIWRKRSLDPAGCALPTPAVASNAAAHVPLGEFN